MKKNLNVFMYLISYWLFNLFFVQALITIELLAQDNLDNIRANWKNGKYEEAFLSLKEIRDGEPYMKNVDVDYLLATSACRIQDVEIKSYADKIFNKILKDYSIDTDTRKKIENAINNCDSDTKPEEIQFTINSPAGVSASNRGKDMYLSGVKNEDLSLSAPVRLIRQIDLKEFNERLFKISEKNDAIIHTKNILGSNFVVESFDNFILASTSDISQSELKEIGQLLERAFSFFMIHYSMPTPSYLITVYIVPNQDELKTLAKKIHGIESWNATVGYSSVLDLSFVYSSASGSGTGIHELFHLMVRNNFGDIPPWLDEGIASLYEVSKFHDNLLVGLPNWREEYLNEFWEERPTVEEIVKMSWPSLAGGVSMKQAAINSAMLRYFVLYLQERNELVSVYHTFRTRKIEDIETDLGTDAVKLVESILQKPISEVDKDFVSWYNNDKEKIWGKYSDY